MGKKSTKVDVSLVTRPQASAPTDPEVGEIYFDSSEGCHKFYDGSQWVPFGSLVPTGSVLAFSGPTAPKGYLVCDGSAVSRTTYATLFAMIGTAHGTGDGSTTFNLPDYRGRFLRGVSGNSANDPNKATRVAMNTGGNAGNLVGTVQAQATAKNGLYDNGHAHSTVNTNQSGTAGGIYTSGTNVSTPQAAAYNTNSGSSDIRSTDSETRPLNAYVNYIVKY